MKNLLIFSIVFLFACSLFSSEKSFVNSSQVGILYDNPNKSMLFTIGTTKQYIFNDFMIGMDFNILFLGQENFKDFGGLQLTPKLGMIIIGNDKSDFYSSIYVNSGISSMNNDNKNALGYSGGIGIEARSLNYGLNFGYVSSLCNRAILCTLLLSLGPKANGLL